MTAYMPQSKSDVHLTPDRVYELIYGKWGYEKHEMFDPCPVNPRFDGLLIDWQHTNFINPPYSDLPFWVIKAFEESNNGKTSIMLLPAKTDQDFFHWLLDNDCKMIWIKRRLQFNILKCNFDGCINTRKAFFGSTQSHFLVLIKASHKVTGYLEGQRND